MNATSTFKTEKAERYLGTLCKHFAHKVPASFDNGKGRIDLPFAACTLQADATGLTLAVNADTAANLSKAKQVLSSHLERFAFREQPQLVWQDDATSPA